jgi:hypothetical protein
MQMSSFQAVKEFVTGLELKYCDTYAITNLSIERELTENIDSMAHQIPFCVVLGKILFTILAIYYL